MMQTGHCPQNATISPVSVREISTVITESSVYGVVKQYPRSLLTYCKLFTCQVQLVI